MTAATTGAAQIARPVRPALDRPLAMGLAATEYARFRDQLSRLSPADWARPTVCEAWDVRSMAGHVLGMAEMSASVPETIRQMRAARRAGGVFVDALTALQVDKERALSADEVMTKLGTVGPKAAKGRRRTPSFIRRRTMPDEQPVDGKTQLEKWTFGFLLDVILTRDTWMHRTDIALAAGQPPELTADHDGVLVADVAAEWAARHGQPCTLTLTGPAGGSWTWGSGGEVLTLDAVEFCRILSGRGHGTGLLATRVPF